MRLAGVAFTLDRHGTDVRARQRELERSEAGGTLGDLCGELVDFVGARAVLRSGVLDFPVKLAC